MIQNPNTTTQVVQVPTTSGTPGVGNGPNQTGQVKYIKVPTGTTRATYNLGSTPSTKVAPVTTTATASATLVAAGRIGVGPQGIQVKQEPSPPGNITTPKASSTIVRRGRSQSTPTISVVETVPEENEYIIEELEGSESDPTELYQILAELSGSEGELEEGLEPEIEPPI